MLLEFYYKSFLERLFKRDHTHMIEAAGSVSWGSKQGNRSQLNPTESRDGAQLSGAPALALTSTSSQITVRHSGIEAAAAAAADSESLAPIHT